MERDDLAGGLGDGPEGIGGGERGAGGFLAGVVLGALIGVGTALLLAPEPGHRTRRRLGRRVRSMSERAVEELDDATRHRRRQMRKGLGRRRRDLRRRLRDVLSDAL